MNYPNRFSCLASHRAAATPVLATAGSRLLARKISKDISKVVGAMDDLLRVCLMFPLGDGLHNLEGVLGFEYTWP